MQPAPKLSGRADRLVYGRQGIAEWLAERPGSPPRAVVRRVIDDYLDVAGGILSGGQRLEFRGFGCFRVEWRKETDKFIPSLVKKVTVPGHWVVKFTPGKALASAVAAQDPPEAAKAPHKAPPKAPKGPRTPASRGRRGRVRGRRSARSD